MLLRYNNGFVGSMGARAGRDDGDTPPAARPSPENGSCCALGFFGGGEAVTV